EHAPESPAQDKTPASSGGMPPMPPVEPEEEANLPPERPLPPQGSHHLSQYNESNFTVSSWDQNDDLIRFQIDWNDGSMSSWSTFVSSNETMIFTKSFTEVREYDVRVRAQDESGMNSSWSEAFTVIVSNEQEEETEEDSEDSGIVATVNNETGETQFSIENDASNLQGKTVVWDFGDGTILEGSSSQHHYTKPGIYTVKVTVTDEWGNTSMKTYTVTIPEPEQKIDTSDVESKQNENGSVSWFLILIGIIVSIVAVILIIRFR
ncbi:MAG TPA: PKD domain-containing protein, partial [Candidatus Thermoplasmatota archaeon]|nr:PKD domain-containing protein [Candidatus Thermoplasmatota archaeon]